MNYTYISEETEQEILDSYESKRRNHVKNVMELSVSLAEKFNVDTEKVHVAALFHDIAKEMEVEEMVAILESSGIFIEQEYHNRNILHGPCAAVIAYEYYGISDKDILYAIYYHTFGRPDMTMYEKILFIADATEKGRTYRNVNKIRKMLNTDIDAAIEMSLSGTVAYILSKGDVLFPETAAALDYIQDCKKR